jgi:FkbM family methyltransferase
VKTPSSYDLKLLLTENPALYRRLGKPYRALRFFLRQPHDPDYGAFALFPERRGLFLDVGANAGQSALSFRVYRDNPILSIEPNPFHRPDLVLAGRLVRNFHFITAGAGATADQMVLYVPVYRGIPITAEAALDLETVLGSPSLHDYLGDRMEEPDFSIVEVPTPVMPLDDLGLSPDFVKLDVQGHEHAALLGLESTLRRSRPVLLVEAPGDDVRGFLDSLGYEPRLYDPVANRIVAEDHDATNVLFVPGGTA